MSDDLNIALRVQAQLDEARRGVQALKGDVVDLGQAGKKASSDLSNVPVPGAPAQSAGSGTKSTVDAANAATAAVQQTTAAIVEQTTATTAQAAATEQAAVAQTKKAAATEQAAAAEEKHAVAVTKTDDGAGALKVRTEAANDATAAIKQTTAAIQEQTAATTAQVTAVDQETASKTQQASATEKAAAAEERRAAVLAKTAGTPEQEARLTAFKEQQAKTSGDVAAATERERLAIDRLAACLDPAGTDTQRLAAAQTELSTALSKGLITQEQHNRLLGLAQQRYNGMGVSAAQTTAALRMLPAQFTDIGTSIAGGMPLWLIAIQQGGQIKDSFGGIAPAAKAMLSILSPAKLAIGGLAVGVGTLAAIMLKGERDAMAYNVAIRTTGNAAGATQGRIEALAEEANRVSGINKGAAEKAAVAMVQSGRLGIEVISNLTKSVNGFGAATGSTTDAAATTLAKMFLDPAAAAKELDDQFNFLSASQRRHITLLVEQGKTEQAQLELSRATADHFGKVVPENLGVLQRAWNGVAGAAGQAWNAMLDWGKGPTLEDQIKTQEAAIQGLEEKIRTGGGRSEARRQALLVAARGELARLQVEQERQGAKADESAAEKTKARRVKLLREQFDAETKTYQTGAEQLAKAKKDLDELRAVGLANGGISEAEYTARLKAVTERANKGTPKGDTAEQVAIQKVKSDLKALQTAIRDGDAMVVKALDDGRMSLNQVYQKRLELLQQDSNAQRKALNAEAGTAGTTKARKVEIQAQLRVLGDSLKAGERDLKTWRDAEQLKLANLVVRLRVDTAGLTGQFDRADIEKQLRQQYADDIKATGRISDPTEAAAAKQRIETLIQAAAAQAEFNNKLAEAQRLQSQLGVLEQAIQVRVNNGMISQIEGEAQIRQARAAQIPLLQAIVTELDRIKGTLPEGAAVAVDNMSTSIGQLRNEVASATPVVVDLGTRLKNTMVDGLADAAANAVANFSNLRDAASNMLKSIAADIVRSDIKRLLTSLFTVDSGGSGGATVIGSIVSGARSIFGYAEGGSLSSSGGRIIGPGTGTSDSIPALVDGKRPIRVSNGEFIQNERAVRHYGLDFMEAVRTLRLPKPAFAFGGLVAASQRVRYATGGAVTSSSGSQTDQLPNVLVRFTNTGTAKQQTGDAKLSRESGRMVIDIMIADAQNGGRATRAIKAAIARDD